MPVPFQPDDLLLYQEITELDCVPNLEVAACEVKTLSQEQDTSSTAIWLVPLDGSAPRAFTTGPADSMPRWSPDGSQLAFLSSRGGGRQIHLIRREGGEAQQLSHIPSGAMAIGWAPDGRRLLAVCTLTIDPDTRGDRNSQGNQNRPTYAPKLVWRLPYKLDGIGYILDTEIHLFTVDAQTGEHIQLTDGPYEVRSAQWSPDCRQIVYTRTREGRFAHRTDVWLMDEDGSNQRQISHDVAIVQYPKWSPDGRFILFTGSADEGDAQMRLWLYDVATNSVKPLGDEALEVVSGKTVYWSPDSSKVVLVLARRGRQEVATVSVPSGELNRLVTGDRQITQVACTREHLVFVNEDARTANDVCSVDWHGKGETRLTDFNPWWRDRILPEVETRKFEVPDCDGGQETIEGWLLRPPGANGPLPLLVDVHGGPATYALVAYNWRAYWSVLVSRGWAVLALNPVGSSSYGRDFSARARGRWGKADLDQHLAAIESLREEGLADKRVAITGKSYGGFLAAWAIGNTREFRAAVVCAPISDVEAHYATSDSGYYADAYSMFGQPKVQRDKMRELSPMTHVEKARTPTLILQGEEDQRCPKSQSEELFVALMSSTDTPTEMVLYPGAGHHFFESGKPSHRIDMVTRLVAWLERWIDTKVEDD
jgi:dipeptidyl aminopeptidase/acylaminoacyl peptidase